MKILLVFENSGDVIPFNVKYNHDLIEYFINETEKKSQNSFNVDKQFTTSIDCKISELNWAISKTNEILYDLIGEKFGKQDNLLDYLDQTFLNKVHSDWVCSQIETIHIDKFRFNKDKNKCKLGNLLHDMYPDEIRSIKVAEAMIKLGYIFPYEEVNMGVHRLESCFSNIEFKTNDKWEVFENPFIDSMITNNDVMNFSFGYTYVGRQYYNKFRFFDLNLENPDNYNYETLEFAFQINLNQPETIPFSQEAIIWAEKKNIKLVAEQIPIANAINLEDRLFDYRKILYNNVKQENKAKLILE
jgi:hypothetical protein